MQIGGVIRLGAEPGAAAARYPAIRDMACRMEDVGLDSIWVYDHLLYRWPGKPTDGIWECWTVLSALAQATQRVKIGTIVLCVPFRNPAVLAKMAVTLDEISDGRLILGLGAGWHQPEFDAFGVPFDHRGRRFQEALEIIHPLLHDGRVDYHGTYYSAPDCEIIPRGPRPSGPPILVAGKGPRMLQLIARYADSCNTAWHARRRRGRAHRGAFTPPVRPRAAIRPPWRSPSGSPFCIPTSVPAGWPRRSPAPPRRWSKRCAASKSSASGT